MLMGLLEGHQDFLRTSDLLAPPPALQTTMYLQLPASVSEAYGSASVFHLEAPPVMRSGIIHPPAEFLTQRERPYAKCQRLCNVEGRNFQLSLNIFSIGI